MGSLKAIAEQRIAAPGLRLAAVYPMGAPFGLALGVADAGQAPYVLTHPEYQIFFALGWTRVYSGQIKLTDVLSRGTIARIVPLFDGLRSDKEVNREIARIVGKKDGSVTDEDIFAPEFLSVLRRDPSSTAYYRLREETRLDRWSPPSGIPIILAAAPSDDTVPFANSRDEYDWVKANAPKADVTLVRLASSDHIRAGVEAFLYSIVDLDRREAKSRNESYVRYQTDRTELFSYSCN